MSQSKKVLLYGLSTCPYCRRAKEFIEQHNIQYDLVYVDLLQGAEKEEAVKKVAEYNPRLSFPTIVITGATGPKVYVGLTGEAEGALLDVAGKGGSHVGAAYEGSRRPLRNM